MTELEIRENIINLQSELEITINNGEQEQRELNEEETSKLAELRTKLEDLKSQLKEKEEENRKLAENKQNNKLLYNFLKFS